MAKQKRFEKKDYEFTKLCMQKLENWDSLGISVPESYGGMGMGFVSTMLVCDYISGATGSFPQPLEHTLVLELCQSFYMEMRNKSKSTFRS